MSKTPRTDALASVPMTRKDSDDFARQLESDLNTARELHAGAIGLLNEETLRAEKLRELLEQMLNVAENADETGYVTDVGFIDLDKLHEQVRAALALTPAGVVRAVIKAQEQAKPSDLKLD